MAEEKLVRMHLRREPGPRWAVAVATGGLRSTRKVLSLSQVCGVEERARPLQSTEI